MTAKWRYEPETKTIRQQPENYWIATMDSWDGAVNHQANANLIAAAPELVECLRWALDTLGGAGEVPGLPAHQKYTECRALIQRIEE